MRTRNEGRHATKIKSFQSDYEIFKCLPSQTITHGMWVILGNKKSWQEHDEKSQMHFVDSTYITLILNIRWD